MTEPAATLATQSADNRPSRLPIILGLAATLLIAMTAIVMLLRASLRSPIQHHVLVIRAGPEWDRTLLIVEGAALKEPRVAMIEKLGNYMVPFFLPPGEYKFSAEIGGEEVYTKAVNLLVQAEETIDLPRVAKPIPPATSPASQPR